MHIALSGSVAADGGNRPPRNGNVGKPASKFLVDSETGVPHERNLRGGRAGVRLFPSWKRECRCQDPSSGGRDTSCATGDDAAGRRYGTRSAHAFTGRHEAHGRQAVRIVARAVEEGSQEHATSDQDRDELQKRAPVYRGRYLLRKGA